MQIDADPQDDQQNAPDTNYVVENPTLVCCLNPYTLMLYCISHYVFDSLHNRVIPLKLLAMLSE